MVSNFFFKFSRSLTIWEMQTKTTLNSVSLLSERPRAIQYNKQKPRLVRMLLKSKPCSVHNTVGDSSDFLKKVKQPPFSPDHTPKGLEVPPQTLVHLCLLLLSS